MKISILRIVMMFIVLALAAPARADIRVDPPQKPKPRVEKSSTGSARMVIRASDSATEATLQIPRSLVGKVSAKLEDDASPYPSRLNAILAGVFLSLSLAMGGVLLFRYKRGKFGHKMIIAAFVFIAGSAIFASADMPRPGPDRHRVDAGTLSQAITNGEALYGTVKVEIVDEGDQITLIVPANR